MDKILILLAGLSAFSLATANAYDKDAYRCQDVAGKSSHTFMNASLKASAKCIKNSSSYGENESSCLYFDVDYQDLDDDFSKNVNKARVRLEEGITKGCTDALVMASSFQSPCAAKTKDSLSSCLLNYGFGNNTNNIQLLVSNQGELESREESACRKQIMRAVNSYVKRLLGQRRKCGASILKDRSCDAEKMTSMIEGFRERYLDHAISGCQAADIGSMPFYQCMSDNPDDTISCIFTRVESEGHAASDIIYPTAS